MITESEELAVVAGVLINEGDFQEIDAHPAAVSHDSKDQCLELVVPEPGGPTPLCWQAGQQSPRAVALDIRLGWARRPTEGKLHQRLLVAPLPHGPCRYLSVGNRRSSLSSRSLGIYL